MRPARHAALQQRFTPAPLALAAAMAIALVAGQTPLAHAQGSVAAAAAPVAFNIPAQPLGQALNELARQANLQMTFPAALVAGKQAPAVSGQLTVRQALDRLLATSGLVGVADGGSVVIRLAEVVATPEVVLPTVTVSASGEPLPGELPVPFSGGQVAKGLSLGILGARDIFETPLSVKSLTAQGVRDSMATTMTDIVSREPSAISNTHGGTYEYVSIRGFVTQTNYDGLYNGLRVPNVQPVIPELYERINVVRGPSALLNAQLGQIGGSLDFIPKFAGPLPLTEFSLGFRTSNQVRSHVDLSRRFGENDAWGARINLISNDGKQYARDSNQDVKAGSLALDYKDEAIRAGLIIEKADTDIRNFASFWQSYTGNGPVPVGDPRKFGMFGRFVKTQSDRALLQVEYDLSPTWTTYLKTARSEIAQTSVDPYGCNFDISGVCTINPFFLDWRYGYTASEVGLRGNFAIGSTTHQAVVGYSQSKNNLNEINAGEFLPSVINIYSPPRQLELSGFSYTYDNFTVNRLESVVAADTIGLLNDKVQLTIGLRSQQISQTGSSSVGPNPSYSKRVTTPLYAVLVKPTENLSLYANTIEALEQGPRSSPGATNHPITLAPIQSTQTEVGIKWNKGNWGLSGALFSIKRPVAFTDPVSGLFGLNGLTRSKGIEVEAFGQPTSGVRILGGVTLLDAKLARTNNGINQGNYLPGTPKFILKAGGEWDWHVIEGFSWTGGLTYASKQFANNSNAAFIKPWTIVDFGFRYRINEKTTVRARIDNVFDRRYFSSADQRGDGGVVMGAPRTASLSVTHRF